MGLRKKKGIVVGLSAEQNLWFRLILETVEESPFSRNILNFGRGIDKACLGIMLSVRRSSCISVDALINPDWLDQRRLYSFEYCLLLA